MSENEMSEKLKNFSVFVMEDAEKKRNDIIEKAKQKTKEQIDQKETEFLTEAYEKIQRKLQKYKKEDNERVLQVEIQAKRDLFLKREEIIRSVFEGVKDKIQEFRNTQAYREWLASLLDRALKEVGEGDKTVFADPRDIELLNDICAGQNIPVQATEEPDFIGGITVYNHDRHVAVDYSFKELIAGRKAEFLQTSGLVIE